MKLSLHRNLGILSTLAATDAARYSLSAVRLEARDDGTYRAEATDGRLLARVTGASLNGHAAGTVLVEAKGWKDAFTLARRVKAPVKGVVVQFEKSS